MRSCRPEHGTTIDRCGKVNLDLPAYMAGKKRRRTLVAAVRAGLVLGFAALALFVVLTLMQLYGVNLLAVLLVGVGSGVMAGGGRRGSGVGRGLTAGFVGGLVMLIGSLFVGILIVTFFRAQINLWLAGIPFIDAVPVVGDTLTEANEWAEPWLRGGGLALGGCLGMVNFALMAAGGAVGGALGRR